MNETSPKISIIIPVYKVEQYLPKCIDSILEQTYQNWELLLIDDGSPDNSGKICDAYALNDARIRVLHKENGGVSSARNLGLEYAQGEWVTFVDSDDYIQPGFLEGLYNPIARGEDVDFVHGGCVNVENEEFVDVNQSYEYYVGEDKGFLFQKLRGLTISKLFRIDIIRHWTDCLSLRFDEKMRIAEDMAFTLDYALRVKRFALVPELGYCYRIDNMDSATKIKKIDSYNVQLHSFEHLYRSVMAYIHECGIPNEFAEVRLGYLASQLQNTCLALYYNKYLRKERLRSLKSDLTKEYLSLLSRTKGNSLKNRLFQLLANGHYYLFDAIFVVLIGSKLKLRKYTT